MSVTVIIEFKGKFTSESAKKGQKQGFLGREFSGWFSYEPAGYDQEDPYHNWGQSWVHVVSSHIEERLDGEQTNILFKSDIDKLEFSDSPKVRPPMGIDKEWWLHLTIADNVDLKKPIPADQITKARFYFRDKDERDEGEWDVTASGLVTQITIPPAPPKNFRIEGAPAPPKNFRIKEVK